MKSVKSPGGSMFPYYYKGGEIHCLKYGSFHSNSDALVKLMGEEEIFIKISDKKLRVWVDLYETKLTKNVLLKFCENIQSLDNHIIKLSIVGCSHFNRWKLKRLSKKTGCQFKMPVSFFDDPEDAKTWLVC